MQQLRRDQLTEADVLARLRGIGASDEQTGLFFDPQTRGQLPAFGRTVENFIGTLKVPMGAVGPLRIHGAHGSRTYQVPLATTEAALVASYGRGAKTLSEAGGCTARIVDQQVARSPLFGFAGVAEALVFRDWLAVHLAEIRAIAEATTRHGRLLAVDTTLEGNRVYAIFRYSTAEAAGQNMVTLATHAACRYIAAQAPGVVETYLEANFSSDKKASAQSLQGTRGRRAIAEAVLPAELVERRLHCTPRGLQEYWQIGVIGATMSGQIGAQAHYANAIAAFYLASGQDVACTAESAIGITRFGLLENGDLYASVTLPNVIVGSVGGGTSLPTQRAVVDLLDLPAAGKADSLAEIVAALCLAGELSISAAMVADHFAQAHQRLARGVDAP